MSSFSPFYILFSFTIVVALLPLCSRLAVKFGFVDHPGGRKRHEDPIPPIGGLVIFPVFMILAGMQNIEWSYYLYLYLALTLLIVIGAIDDFLEVAPRIKFSAQCIAALLIVIPGQAQIVVMGDLFGFGTFGLNFVAIPFSITATVLLINAVNLMDGLDGLAGGKSFCIFLMMALACFLAGDTNSLFLLLTMMGCIAGFLIYNMRHPFRQKASIFLGDSGALALGLSIAWFSIHLAKGEDPVLAPISVAWFLALPIYDTCGQFARRVAEGRHPFDADHDHFHHHFIHAGFSVGQATAIIISICLFTGGIGLFGIKLGLPEAVLTYPWIALLFIHIYFSMKPERFRNLVSKLRLGK